MCELSRWCERNKTILNALQQCKLMYYLLYSITHSYILMSY